MQTPNFLNRFFLILRRAAAMLGAVAVASLAAEPAGLATASDETRMSAEAALRVLLGDAAPGLPRPAVESFPIPPRQEALPAASALKVVVRPGDTVDGLLRRHLGDSVFSPKFQRQALIRLNPAVFQNGQLHRLEVGSTLWIPTDMVMMGLLPGARRDTSLAQAEVAALQGGAAGQDASSAVRPPVHTPSPSRGWVRYP